MLLISWGIYASSKRAVRLLEVAGVNKPATFGRQKSEVNAKIEIAAFSAGASLNVEDLHHRFIDSPQRGSGTAEALHTKKRVEPLCQKRYEELAVHTCSAG